MSKHGPSPGRAIVQAYVKQLEDDRDHEANGWADADKEIERLQARVSELEKLVCLCGVEGPDEFGNHELIEHDDCPIHGAA